MCKSCDVVKIRDELQLEDEGGNFQPNDWEKKSQPFVQGFLLSCDQLKQMFVYAYDFKCVKISVFHQSHELKSYIIKTINLYEKICFLNLRNCFIRFYFFFPKPLSPFHTLVSESDNFWSLILQLPIDAMEYSALFLHQRKFPEKLFVVFCLHIEFCL